MTGIIPRAGVYIRLGSFSWRFGINGNCTPKRVCIIYHAVNKIFTTIRVLFCAYNFVTFRMLMGY
jgi:hypothetical protein